MIRLKRNQNKILLKYLWLFNEPEDLRIPETAGFFYGFNTP